MSIYPRIYLLIAPFILFFLASIAWFLVLVQIIGFFWGWIFLSFITFVIFWQGFLINRRAGELFGFRSKRQIFFITLGLTLGFSELIWVISFLPFSFYVLGGILTVIFIIIFDIFKEIFAQRPNLFIDLDQSNFRKVLLKGIFIGAIFIILLLMISSWFPSRY